MKVKAVINILEKIVTILKPYENHSVTQMLDDIHIKIQDNTNDTVQAEKPSKTEIDFTNIISNLENMNKEQINGFLIKFKKEELLSIGRYINLGLQPKDKKTILIDAIANHYSFIQLNRHMAQRNEKKVKSPH